MLRKVILFHPGIGFRTLSVTGRACSLQCEHCRGRYLHQMTDVSAKGSIVKVGHELQCKGFQGILISGGCRQDGTIPLAERAEEISELVRAGLMVNIHTGLLDDKGAKVLAATGAHSFSIDVHGSEQVIKDVLHLKAAPADFERTVEVMCDHAPGKVSPHILAGLEGDSISSERDALKMCSGKELASVILLKHMRTKGAPLDPRPHLSDAKFLDLVELAVERVDVPVLIGCMRPRPSADLEVECVKRGASGIASPSPSTGKRLQALGYEVLESNLCCSVHL